MRRKDRERLDSEFFKEVFSKADTMFLAMLSGGQPYCIPVNFARIDNKLYIHAALQGHKLDCIAHDPHVAFSMAVDVAIDVEKSTTYYKSVCGTGLASIVLNAEEKGQALDAIAVRYGAKCARPAPASVIRQVAIIRIDIETLSGKSREPA